MLLAPSVRSRGGPDRPWNCLPLEASINRKRRDSLPGVASYGIDGTPAIESPPGGGLAVGEPAFEETVPDLVGLPTAVPDPRATQSSVRYV